MNRPVWVVPEEQVLHAQGRCPCDVGTIYLVVKARVKSYFVCDVCGYTDKEKPKWPKDSTFSAISLPPLWRKW